MRMPHPNAELFAATDAHPRPAPHQEGKLPLHWAAICDAGPKVVQALLVKYPKGAETEDNVRAPHAARRCPPSRVLASARYRTSQASHEPTRPKHTAPAA